MPPNRPPLENGTDLPGDRSRSTDQESPRLQGSTTFGSKVIAILKFENPGLSAFLNELQGKRDQSIEGPRLERVAKPPSLTQSARGVVLLQASKTRSEYRGPQVRAVGEATRSNLEGPSRPTTYRRNNLQAFGPRSGQVRLVKLGTRIHGVRGRIVKTGRSPVLAIAR